MEKKRAKNNRTITITPDEVAALSQLITPAEAVTDGFDFDNRIIRGDLLAVLDRIPDRLADLIIVDPPYNLSKNFHGMNFQARSQEAYLDYLRATDYQGYLTLEYEGDAENPVPALKQCVEAIRNA